MENTDHLWFGLDHDPDSTKPINFIETRWHDLSPFSAHEVELDGVVYKTAEHAYQALRVKPEKRAAILAARSPMDAWRVAQRAKASDELLQGHDWYAIMERVYRAKLTQHADVEAVLRASGSRELLKVYDTDYYWGTGTDGSGENMLGKLWMALRKEIL